MRKQDLKREPDEHEEELVEPSGSVVHASGLMFLISVLHRARYGSSNRKLPSTWKTIRREYQVSLMPAAIVSEIILLTWIMWVQNSRAAKHKSPKKWISIGCIIEQARNVDRMHDYHKKGCLTFSVPMISINNTFTAYPRNIEYTLKTNFCNYPKSQGDRSFREPTGHATMAPASSKLRDFSIHAFRTEALKLGQVLAIAARNGQKVDLQQQQWTFCPALCRSPMGDQTYTDERLHDVVIAGRNTTTITLSWFFSNFAVIHKKILEEVSNVLAAHLDLSNSMDAASFGERVLEFAQRLKYESLSKMHYLHAAITEALRLYPVVPLKGGFFSYSPYSMGRLEYLWGSDVAELVEIEPRESLVLGHSDLSSGDCKSASPFVLVEFKRCCLSAWYASETVIE
ncbi:protein MpCYP704-like18 [Marchantia polymorpha subsp. ruderalis]|uniref:Cytochrome P450 n=1 Tax=Marchantia polymorpha TaxID=3197 RepID=A0A2R6XLI4_MARPO|nr:hypothetical protein MARPO_0009s0080 [Marchantia polymorpha]|eukprot:PTQ46968.1 hypothetical protein MARPO_0009s0080 [Marchantia polymorpha]